MTWLPRLFALAVLAALMTPADASLMRYNFSGTLIATPYTPISYMNGKHFSGYFDFDSATKPTAPGEWVLPTTTFELTLPDDVYSFTGGATATVSPDGAAMSFIALVPPDQAIFHACCNIKLSLSFNTGMENYFSMTTLPTTAPPGLAGIGYSADFGFILLSRSEGFDLYVPEPASAALVLAGLIGLGWRRRTKNRAEG